MKMLCFQQLQLLNKNCSIVNETHWGRNETLISQKKFYIKVKPNIAFLQ